jgi:hypothetical protein
LVRCRVRPDGLNIEAMMLRWQIFTEPAVHAAVQVAAKRLGISPGEFVRRAIDRELADRGHDQAGGEVRVIPQPATPSWALIHQAAGTAMEAARDQQS